MSAELLAKLDNVMPEFKRVDKAPNRSELERIADETSRSLRSVLEEESHIRYKAISSIDGSFWLLQNPALMQVERPDGTIYMRDIVRERVGSAKEIEKKAPAGGVFSI